MFNGAPFDTHTHTHTLSPKHTHTHTLSLTLTHTRAYLHSHTHKVRHMSSQYLFLNEMISNQFLSEGLYLNF